MTPGLVRYAAMLGLLLLLAMVSGPVLLAFQGLLLYVGPLVFLGLPALVAPIAPRRGIVAFGVLANVSVAISTIAYGGRVQHPIHWGGRPWWTDGEFLIFAATVILFAVAVSLVLSVPIQLSRTRASEAGNAST